MSDTFEAKGDTSQKLPVISQQIMDFAFDQANDFIESGQSEREATSIVANILLRVAWAVAGCGAVAGGAAPDKDKFRSRVEEVLEGTSFGSALSSTEGTEG